MPHTPLIDITHCSVRLGPGFALRDVSWQVLPGENWAFVGANGAGKTTLLRLARGEVHPAQGEHFGHCGSRAWNFGSGATTSPLDARKAMALVTADDHDAMVREDRDMTVEQLVVTGLRDSVFLFSDPTGAEIRSARAALAALGAGHLAGRSALSLSRGQGRLAVIARALARNPRVLLLDEAMEGLDAPARAMLGQALERLAAGGTQIVMASHQLDEIRGFITHAAVMEDGRVLRAGPLDEVLAQGAAPGKSTGMLDLDQALNDGASPPADSFVRLENVSVVRDGQTVLHGIDWTLRPGENWAVLGRNGAGKSTLLGLCTGAIRPSSGQASWFGVPGPCNIWDIRRRIGLVSPELQAAYRYDVTALELVLSGNFASVGLYDRPTPEQEDRAARLIALVGLGGLEKRTIRTLSYGQLRRLLIARAMAPAPALLLLDEPCTGLDPAARSQFLHALEAISASGTTLVFVTHHPRELPAACGMCLVVEHGRIAARGPCAEVLPTLAESPGQP